MKPSERPELRQTVEEILRRWPGTASAFVRLGLADCVGCGMAPFESLADAARHYGVDPARALAALRAAARGRP